jgi:hypothetical protein
MSYKKFVEDEAELDRSLALLEQRLLESLIDDAVLNNSLPPLIRDRVLGGLDCDQLPNGVGEFGRDCSQPIPVNGPIGELAYLSLLRTASGSALMFHRHGSMTLADDETNELFHIDIFEVLSFDMSVRETLYFHMYHPRRSRIAPSGYAIATLPDPDNYFTGTTMYLQDFPVGLDAAVRQTNLNIFGADKPMPLIEQFLNIGEQKMRLAS